MLFDLGLLSEAQRVEHEEMLRKRFTIGSYNGCIDRRICKNCNHLISDSICLCVGYFVCPNCKFENGKELKNLNLNPTFFIP